MINKETILYSLRNLEQRKARSLLTVFSVLLGIAAIFIFISFGLGLQAYISEMSTQTYADKVSIMGLGGAAPGMDPSFALSEEDLDAVEKSSGVKEATGIFFKAAEITQNGNLKYTFLISYDPATPLVWEFFGDIGIRKGRLLRPGEKGKAVLGFSYIVEDKIFPKAYDINDKIEVDGEEITIVGIMDSVGSPPDDAQIYITNEYFKELYPEEGEDGYSWAIARVDIDNMDNAIENIEKNLRKTRNLEEGKEDFFVQSFVDLVESFSGAFDIVVGFIVLIALVSVLVSAINTANTMITSVLERTKEVGIIKSVGAKNSEVLGIFLFESAFLGFVAGVAGVGVGWLFSSAAGKLLISLGWGFISPVFPTALFVGCILFAVITGSVSGIMPAIRASKIKPVDALRYE
jgi:putative ABC transport system permease protein